MSTTPAALPPELDPAQPDPTLEPEAGEQPGEKHRQDRNDPQRQPGAGHEEESV